MLTNKQTAARIIRWATLALSTAFFLFFSSFISEHAICPIGGFEMFFTGLFKTGFTLAGLLSGMVLVFLINSVLSILLRRAYCGYLCPMGAFQELFERVGKLVLPKKLKNMRIAPKADKALRWVKYAVLLSFVVGAAVIGGHWMIPGDPFLVMMNLFAKGGIASSWARLPFAVLFFGAILIFAFFFGRGFCKYLCPAGAWYAILSKVSPTKVVRDEGLCVGCGLCSKACPMNIDVATLESVTSAECIGCLECVAACPSKGALAMKVGPVAIPPLLVPIVSAAVFTGGVAIAASAMPARGGRPEGGQRPLASDATSGAVILDGAEGGESGMAAKVGYGGCPSCVGCGICGA